MKSKSSLPLKFVRHIVEGLVALALVMMAAAPVLAARPRIQAPGEVTIVSLTNGATVEIDGKPVGIVPLEDSLVLLPGRHTVTMKRRGFSEYTDTFEVKPGQSSELEIDLLPYAGMVKITTAEPGATVKIDGKIEGVTPFDKDVPAGRRVIAIARPDCYDEIRVLQIRAGEFYELDVALRPLVTSQVPDGGGAAFYETWWFWTLVGVAGAGAAAAALATSGGVTISPNPDFSLDVP